MMQSTQVMRRSKIAERNLMTKANSIFFDGCAQVGTARGSGSGISGLE